jgi:adenylate cyclase
LSEELLNLLAQIPQLKVIARTSSFSFKGKETDVATIAKVLNVAHILEGSVRKSGDTLRITAQLIRTSDSTHLWSQTYDRPMADIFAVQDEIAKDVVEALKVKLLPNQNVARVSGNSTNPEAYRLLLLGRNYFEQFTLEGYQQAAAAQQQAIALDPNYAMAYAELATTQVNLSYNESNADAQLVGFTQAQAWAEKAITLEPQLSAGYRSRSKVCEALRDVSCELSAAQQAIALEPGNSSNQLRYGKVRFYRFDINGALAAINKSIELDPLESEAYLYLGWLQFVRGDYTAAHKTFTVLNQLKPNFEGGLQLIGMSSIIQGNTQQARNYFEKVTDQDLRKIDLALLRCHEGSTAEADLLLAKWLKDSNNRYAEIAMLYACRGDADQAFVWLDKLIKKNDTLSRSYVFYGLEFQPLHSDPRWLPLLRKAGATPEQLATYKSHAVLPNKRVGKP